MDRATREKQIEQMCRFIQQEAEEKATEIRQKTENDRQKEMQLLVVTGKQAIKKKYEQLRKDLTVQKRIVHAQASAEQMKSKMHGREKLLKGLLKDVKNQLSTLSSDDGYGDLIVKLIVQACIKLQETYVTIICRECDKDVVAKALPLAHAEFIDYMTKNAKVVPDLKLALAKAFLPPPPDPDRPAALSCVGGIVASAMRGRIKCDNTLDSRLEQAFEGLQPVVRVQLFPSKVYQRRADFGQYTMEHEE